MTNTIFSKPAVIAAASLCLMGTSACMGPSIGSPGMVQSGSAPQAVASFDPTGNWCFEDGSQRNYISNAGGAITVTPSRGRTATFMQISDRLYRDQDGTSTYEFVSRDTAVWRSNKSGGGMIYLVAC